jgi:hypothetical protein
MSKILGGAAELMDGMMNEES